MFVLSNQTAAELQDLLAKTPGSGAGGNGGSASRQVCFVRCESWSTSSGTCVVTEYSAATSAWVLFGSASNTILLSAQGSALTVGTRYVAIRYGVSSDKTVFVAFHEAPAPPPEVGCGLFYDDDILKVKAEDLAGNALKAREDSCKIDVVPGCHITLEGGTKVSVMADSLAGCGLKATPIPDTTCKVLEFDAEAVGIEGIKGVGCNLALNYGCGLDLEPDPSSPGDERIKVYAPDLAGDGLYPGAGCTLNVYPGCGIKIDADKVAVDLDSLKGQGLKIFSGSPCPKIGIQPGCHVSLEGGEKVGVLVDGMAGCGLAVESGGCNKLRIKTTPSSAYVFSAVTSVNLIPQAYGCGFTLVTAVTPFELVTNDCGVVVGFVAGSASTYTSDVSIDVTKCGNICTYCTGTPYYTTAVGKCWDGTAWVTCATVTVLSLMEPPTI